MSRFWTLLFLVAACLLSFVGSESDIKGSDPINSCFCQLEGVLEDCPCEAATVDDFNQKMRHQLSPLLHHPYFRYFQVFLIIPSAGAVLVFSSLFHEDYMMELLQMPKIKPFPSRSISPGLASTGQGMMANV